MRITTTLLLLIGTGFLCRSQENLQIASNGKTRFSIVKSATASEAETFAATELQDYLQRITGADFRLCDDSTILSGPAIHVGNTLYACRNGINQQQLSQEEWVVFCKEGHLILGGGAPRGVLYGVYEFLESQAGCRWYDLHFELVPKNPDLSIPGDLQLRRRPSVKRREFYWVNATLPEYRLWSVRNKFNSHATDAKYGFRDYLGSPNFAHTYYQYSQDFPLDCFSMNAAGERVKAQNAVGPGQLCRSNPLTRQLCTEKLKEYIGKDREKAAKGGYPYPTYYLLMANDNPDICHCPECRRKVAQMGESGLLLEFGNQVAEDIAGEFPEVVVVLDAYSSTQEPPICDIRAHDNVMVMLAVLGVEYLADRGRDVLRPLAHPQNKNYLKLLDGWKNHTSRIGIWDYWRMFCQPFATPVSSIGTRAELMRKYQQIGCEYMFFEGEIYPGMTDHFLDLRNYLCAKLMDDPARDDKLLINDFIKGFYGPAAGIIQEYLNYVETRMNEERKPLATLHPTKWAFLDKAFFQNAYEQLSLAEKLCENKFPAFAEHVRQERFLVDSTLFNLYDFFPEFRGKISKKELLERVLQGEKDFALKYKGAQYWRENQEKRQDTYRSLLHKPPLPEKFKDRYIVADMYWANINSLLKTVVDDEEAAGGKALRLIVSNGLNPETFHAKPMEIGMYAPSTQKKQVLKRVLATSDIPQDEKFHYYYLGRSTIPDGQSLIWVHWSWHIQPKLGQLFDPTRMDQKYDFYLSLKIQGPAYVKASERENNIYLDRVIVTRAED